MILQFIIISILIGWWLGIIEIPAGFSGVAANGILRKRYMGLVIIFFILAGLGYMSDSLSTSLIAQSSLTNATSAVIVAFSASLAVLATYKLSRYSSICYGALGAIMAWNVYAVAHPDPAIGWIVVSWLLAPVLAAAVSALLYYIYRWSVRRHSFHILLLFRYLRWALLIVIVLFATSIGINNGSLIVALIDTISPGFDFSLNGSTIREEYMLAFASIAIIVLICWLPAASRIQRMAKREFDVNIESVFIALLTATLILVLFSFPAICGSFGLIATPLSVAGVVLGGFTGIHLVKRRSGNVYTGVYRMLLATIATPLVSFLIGCFILRVVDSKMLMIDTRNAVLPAHGIINLTPAITVVLILLACTFVMIYMRSQRKIRVKAEVTLLENQNRLFEKQKNLSALETKTVIAENERLNFKLELRRKELINIALGITEQKKIQEEIYADIKSLKEIDNPDELRSAIDRIEKKLLQKMNYSQELESFYAQIEQLHKDFNIRLSEKFPALTEQERRLTTLLRLGFSTKHIASLMNISPKSVEVSRYRLRNRFGLEREQKLINFIKNI